MHTRILVLMALGAALPALAEEGEGMRLAPVDNPAAKAECSACHMAYPAGLLPARSWEALMGDLGNHFGEDATLAPDVAAGIKDYLMANAGDAQGSNRMFRGVAKDQTPLRISELPWFKRAHGGEVSPARLKKAGSYANCVACHQEAAKGFFGDD